MKRTFFIIQFAAVAMTFLGCRPNAHHQESGLEQSISVGILRHESTLPYYVAEEKGFFADQGVKVKFVELPPSDHMPALLAGRVDLISPTSFPTLFGVMAENPDALFAFLPGAEVLDGPPVYGIVVNKTSTAQTIKDIKNGVVMAINPYTKINLEMIFAKIGTTADARPDIRVASREAALQAVLDGVAVAAIMDQPALAIALQDKQVRLLESNPRAKYIGSPYWSGAGAVQQSRWNDKQELFLKVANALNEAINFIRQDSKSAHQILAKRLEIAANVADQIGGYVYARSDEAVEVAGIETTIAALRGADLLKKDVAMDRLFPPQLHTRK